MHYPYAVISIYFLVIWLIFFIIAKGNRKEMLAGSLLGALLGPFVQYMHLIDWWQPNFLFNTGFFKIEDILFGLSVAGISTVIFEVLFRKREVRFRQSIPRYYRVTTFVVGAFLMFFPFFFFKVHSFLTSVACAVGILGLIYIKRIDLLWPSLKAGTMVALISLPIYLLLLANNPLLFEEQWIVSNLSGVELFGIPWEEISWYFFAAASLSCAYEFFYNLKFKD